MPNDQDGESTRGGPSTTRRRLLGAAAVTGAVASIGAVNANRSRQEEPPDGLDPTFGFPAASRDVDPPVEPDHRVTMAVRPVEGREQPEFVFDPVGLQVEPGDVVRFDSELGAHSVTAYHPALERARRVPEAAGPFSSPLLPTGGAYWLYRFDEPGVYDMYCMPHEVFGMVVRVVVGEPAGTPTAVGTGTETAAPTGGSTETGTGTPAGGDTSTPTTGAEDGLTGSPTATPAALQADTPNGTATGSPMGTAGGTPGGSPTGSPDGTPSGSPGGTPTGTPPGSPTPTPGGDGGIQLPETPPTEAALRVFDDPALAVENVVAAGQVAWNDLAPETRGLPTEPTTPTSTPTEGQTYTVDLSGENEVPPVETEASGEGTLRLTEAGLQYDIRVTGIEDVTQAHVHEGMAGENGPILYTLAAYTENVDGSGDGQPRSVLGENTLVIAGVVEDVDESQFDDPSDLYVNVHTVANPGGEIRGQLQPADGAAPETPTDGTPPGTPEETPGGSPTETGTEPPAESPGP